MAAAREDLTPLGRAIYDLRTRLGKEDEDGRRWSHDRLAHHLGTTRQSVINWEKHDVFPRDYTEQLAELGVPRELLRRGEARDHLPARVAQLEGDVALLASLTVRALELLEAPPALLAEAQRLVDAHASRGG